MMVTFVLLLILAATVAALPQSERAAGTLAALAALVTAAVLAATEAGFTMAPDCWLIGVALALATLNYLLGVVETDTGKHREELR